MDAVSCGSGHRHNHSMVPKIYSNSICQVDYLWKKKACRAGSGSVADIYLDLDSSSDDWSIYRVINSKTLRFNIFSNNISSFPIFFLSISVSLLNHHFYLRRQGISFGFGYNPQNISYGNKKI